MADAYLDWTQLTRDTSWHSPEPAEPARAVLLLFVLLLRVLLRVLRQAHVLVPRDPPVVVYVRAVEEGVALRLCDSGAHPSLAVGVPLLDRDPFVAVDVDVLEVRVHLPDAGLLERLELFGVEGLVLVLVRRHEEGHALRPRHAVHGAPGRHLVHRDLAVLLDRPVEVVENIHRGVLRCLNDRLRPQHLGVRTTAFLRRFLLAFGYRKGDKGCHL